MITKSEFQNANEDLMSDERLRLGDPPTAEEVTRYMRGELSSEEEQRIRERLSCDPDLLRALIAEFPVEGASPGDPDYLSDREFEVHWAKIQSRLHSGRVVQFWRTIGAIAAALAITFGALLWRAETELRRERTTPQVAWDQQLLMPDGQRGGVETSPTITAKGEKFLLVTPIVGTSSFDDYRLDIVEGDRTLWSSPTLHRGDQEAFEVLVPRAFLKRGKYQIVMSGVSGARQERVATYTFHMP